MGMGRNLLRRKILMLRLVLPLNMRSLWRKLFRKKMFLFTLGMIGFLSCMSLQAESNLMETLELPLPELPPDFLVELLTEGPEEPLNRQEGIPVSAVLPLEFDMELLKTTIIVPSRPLRIAPAMQPAFFSSETKSWVPPVRQNTIPGLEQPLTQEYINRYSTPGGIAWLDAIMRRGSDYFAFIRKEIEARNLPHELIYLPVIESAYIINAVSRSGATGLWQFMRNSIDPYDMKVTDWMDERMDFWKSTIGALSKLAENYRILGDWPLALAAYNTGLGGLNRVMQQTGIKDYWLLSEKKHLKTETIHYVPKLLAIAYIMSNHRRFGITPLWPDDPEWTRIKVDRTVDLELLATEAGIDKQELKRANRELFYNVTPPDPNYHLKVRTADVEAITAVLERKDLTLIKYHFHAVTSGDTLSVLAKRYGVSVEVILNANPGIKERYLKIGSRLLIPAYKEVSPYQSPQGNTHISSAETHLVKPGETLWSIAKIYHVTPESLANVNGMELNAVLREGRRLKLR
jgi:membrane-bound lytic murein transglycosylase D